MSWRAAAALGVLAIIAAAGIGLGASRLLRPSPAPRVVSVTFTPVPTPVPTPLDEATLFRQPLAAACATSQAVWLVSNGGGLMRWDGADWAQVDGTLRSLTNVRCSQDTVYAIGQLGAILVASEQSRQIRSTDVTTQNFYGVSPMQNGALMVGSNGTVFVLHEGDLQIYAQGIDETLYDVVAFGLESAWAVGDAGITYRLDARGWNAVGSGQAKALHAVAATSPTSVVAVGDDGTVVVWSDGRWRAARSGVEVNLRDVIVEPGVWIAGDRGTLLTSQTATPDASFRRIEMRTDCDLVSVFARNDEIWVVGRAAVGGAVWRLRAADGSLIRKWGAC